MRRRLARRPHKLAPAALVALAVMLFAAAVAARPGGGQSFGGRSGGSSSSGHGGGAACAFDILRFLLTLTIEYPKIGIPLDILVVVIVIVALAQRGRSGASWSTGGASTTTAAAEEAALAVRPSRAVRRDLLTTATRLDPDFSIVLFEDFVYALYAAAQQARGANKLVKLAPYLREGARAALASDAALVEVRTPVIGALRYLDVQGFGAGSPVQVTLEIEANFTEVRRPPAREQAVYVVDRWTLSRAPTARSRPPAKAAVLGCPNCGAPLEDFAGSTCAYCKQVVDNGAFDWVVERVQQVDRMERPPQLTSDDGGTGANLPTVVEPDANAKLRALGERDPSFQWGGFMGRVERVFLAIQPAWSTLAWESARPYVSDQLFQMLAYWIESYKRAHLRNVTENAHVRAVEVASVISDRYYDAITVRVHASGLDYTVTDAGEVVSGSRTQERAYTEYWTFIRGASVKTRATPEKECPNCGAPLAINMAGSCDHCHAKVTSGDFDWVLSRIEQDSAYTG